MVIHRSPVGLGDMPLVPTAAWKSVSEAKGKNSDSLIRWKNPRPPVKIDQELWSLIPISGDEGARFPLLRLLARLVG
ncbi:MAG: hypothetical protein Ct9H90mP30_0520 [Actinomycetota bacterium]|nr:MAG: hypothetical protein Ct9H90mP30_0520 [Actinomycetota bacterium]